MDRRRILGLAGVSMTVVAAVFAGVVSMNGGIPLSMSATSIGGVNAEFAMMDGEGINMQPTVGGNQCDSLLIGTVQRAEVREMRMYKDVDVPFTDTEVSFDVTIASDQNVTIRGATLKVTRLEAEEMSMQNTSGSGNPETAFQLEGEEFRMSNGTGKIYALSAESVEVPLTIPQIGLGLDSEGGSGLNTSVTADSGCRAS